MNSDIDTYAMIKGATILALDDNEMTLQTYQRCFESAGHRVILSNTSDQAIALARRHHPRLALVDIGLSGKDSRDGYAVSRELRIGQDAPPAVFLVTAHDRGAPNRLRAFESGAVAFYDKFVPPNLLLDDITFFLKGPSPFFQMNSGQEALGPSTPRVVVIDDDIDQVDAITLTLEADGIAPYRAHNARHGILLSHLISPDAIILDIDLPDMTGTEALSALKAHPATKNIPVIIWTGSEKRGQELTCMRDGAAQYLIKGVHEIPAIPLHVRARLGEKNHHDSGRLMRGPITIEMQSRTVLAEGRRIDGLTSKEFALLVYVMKRSPDIASWPEIERDVWDFPTILQTQTHAPKTLTVHLNELKKKLGTSARCLITHRGLGLQFDPTR